MKWVDMEHKQAWKYYQEMDEEPEDKAYELSMPYIYIKGCNETQKMRETLRTQVDLDNDGIDDDNGTNNKRNNLMCAHTTENENKQYSHRQVHCSSNGLLMDSECLIIILNNHKRLGKSYYPHDWTFDYRIPRDKELKQRKSRSEEFKCKRNTEVGAPLF